jgi:hypothetical protein
VLAPIVGCQRVAIGTDRSADDPSLVVAGLLGGRLPGLVVRHRTFDREHAAVVVGDNQEKWLAGIVSRHGTFYY